jgi:HEPN domain-containing protein
MASPDDAEAWRSSAERMLQSAADLRAVGQDWPTVYRLSGESVEFMLKAIRMKREGLTSWPATDRGAKWHRLTFLAERCSLHKRLAAEAANGTALGGNWLTVRDWDFQRRFPGHVAEREARDILGAVNHPLDGVMQWLRQLYQRI